MREIWMLSSIKKYVSLGDAKPRKAFLAAIREGRSVSVACSHAMITRPTFYNTLKSDEDFALEYGKALADCQSDHTKIVLDEIKTGAITKTKETRQTIKSTDGEVLYTNIVERETIAPAGQAALAFLRKRFPEDWEPALAEWRGKDKKVSLRLILEDGEWSEILKDLLAESGLEIARIAG
jgi:hypothetical protein